MARIKFSVVRLMLLISLAAIFFALVDDSQRADDSRSRLSCAGNLRQLAFGALGTIRSNNGEFPRGEILAGMIPEKGTSWIRRISSYLDISDAYSATDGSMPYDVMPNLQFARSHVSGLTCPACQNTTTAGGFATTSYVGIAGVGADAPALAAGHPRAGIFGYTRVTRMADLKDGTSQTMMLAETGLNNGCWMSGGSATIRAAVPARRPYIGQGRPFGGLHKRGVNVAFADGSIRLISKAVDPKVFEAMTTIAGGEPVPDGAGWP
jgi:prepilin-type processing-associated H-X9-DG protein